MQWVRIGKSNALLEASCPQLAIMGKAQKLGGSGQKPSRSPNQLLSRAEDVELDLWSAAQPWVRWPRPSLEAGRARVGWNAHSTNQTAPTHPRPLSWKQPPISASRLRCTASRRAGAPGEWIERVRQPANITNPNHRPSKEPLQAHPSLSAPLHHRSSDNAAFPRPRTPLPGRPGWDGQVRGLY